MTELAASNPRRQGEVAIIAKTWQDEAFKQALVTNPKAAIEQELGFTYPDHVTVQVIEALPNVLYIRLPEKPDSANTTSFEELTLSLAKWESAAMAQLIAKAWKDDLFKQALLSNPKMILSQEFGIAMPEDLQVQVFPENPQYFVLILPVKPEVAIELSDEELESVSGGVTPLADALFLFNAAAIVNPLRQNATGVIRLTSSIAGGVPTYSETPPW